MLLSLLLAAALEAQTAPPRPAPAPPAPRADVAAAPSHAAAAEMAESGDLEGALRAFEQIAAVNPNDRDARMWIGQLHLRMHHADRAELVYRSVLLEHPSDVDAMLGVGVALIDRHEYGAARDVLAAAEKATSDNADVLVAIGRIHAAQGRTVQAVEYFRRAAALAPSARNRMLFERARLVNGHRVESTGLVEQFPGRSSDTRGADVSVNLRASERWRFAGRGQVERKFGRTDSRAGAGFEWRWKPAIVLAGHALTGHGNRVLPQNEIDGEIRYAREASQWNVEYRYLDFFGARASVIGPSVAWAPTDRLALDVRYLLVASDLATSSAVETTGAARILGEYQLRPRAAVTAAWAHGIENFDAVSIDRIGSFDATTASAGVRFAFPSLTSLFVGYDHQWRVAGARMRRATVSLAHRF